MDNIMFISWSVGIFSTSLLALIMRMKKTDPVFGCDKHKREGCKKVSGLDCNFPHCATLEKYRSYNTSCKG